MSQVKQGCWSGRKSRQPIKVATPGDNVSIFLRADEPIDSVDVGLFSRSLSNIRNDRRVRSGILIGVL